MSEDKRKPGNPGWKPGQSGNPNGRPLGSKNKATTAIREAYQAITEANLENMTYWLAQVGEHNPEKAFQMMLQMAEYVLPKLARTEVTGADGEDLFKDVKFTFGPPVNDPIGRIQDWDINDLETEED